MFLSCDDSLSLTHSHKMKEKHLKGQRVKKRMTLEHILILYSSPSSAVQVFNCAVIVTAEHLQQINRS